MPTRPRVPRAWGLRAAAPGGVDGRSAKLAATVAARMVDDVAARGWPIGEVIGSEAELLEHYGVSRAVFREAVRLVEHQHVARMRRGPGGGLVVVEPDVSAVIDAAVIYLLRVGAPLDEVFEARLVVEEAVTTVAADRLDESDVARVRELMKSEAAGLTTDPRALHSLLAQATRNPVATLFVDMLTSLTNYYIESRATYAPPTVAAVGHAHQKIGEAVIAGNGALAQRRMATHLRAEADYIRARRGTRQAINSAAAIKGPDGAKRAEGVARQIFRRIVGEHLEPGALLGSEAELMAEHDVSRAVLREAVRLLEHHHIAAMRRGPGGGLFVVPPNVNAVSDVVAVYLERHDVTQPHLAELRIAVELALIDMVIDNHGADVDARLREALIAEASATDGDMIEVVHDLHAVIAALSGNRVLELLARTLIRLTRVQDTRRPARAREAIRAEIHRTHTGISQAVIDDDRALAHRRMRRHLEVLTRELR